MDYTSIIQYMNTNAEQGETSLAELQAQIESLEIRNEDLLSDLKESMSEVQLAIDDIGWQPLGGQAEGIHEIPLIKLKRLSELCRALTTVNPLVKNGVGIRTSWIWGDGVKISVSSSTRGRPRSSDTELPKSLRRVFGSTQAQMELERSLAADGQLFFLCDPRTRTVQRLPFWQITGAVTENGDSETVLYYKRTWDDSEVDLDTGVTEGAMTEMWYPSSELEGQPTDKVMHVPVDTRRRIVHIPVNRMTGWRWGVPDVFPCIFWSKAYKEFLENCATLTKAYARFAWKVTSQTGRGTARVAAQIAAAPQRDPLTGKPLQVGASAVLGAGQDLTAIQRSTGVNFNEGRPLAAMVAAGLGVPLPMLTTDPGDGSRSTAETLDEPTILSMRARQNLMDDAIKEVCRVLRYNVVIEWPEIDAEPVHRRIQAIDMAGRSGTIFPKEWRAMLLEALGPKYLERYPERVPKEDDVPLILKNSVPKSEEEQAKEDQRQLDLQKQRAALTPANPAQDGRSSTQPKQPDPPSRGDHELRDEGSQAHTED